MDKTKNITEIPEWFAGSRLNYAENLLRCKDSNKTAIIECGMCVYVYVCVCVCAYACVCIHACVCVLTIIYTLLEASFMYICIVTIGLDMNKN